MKVPDLRPTLLDRVVARLDPERGIARLRARMALAIAGQFTGARTDRTSMGGWLPIGGSADADTISDLKRLRRRSRDLRRNNGLAAGAISTPTHAAVGTGLMVRSRVDATTLGITDERAQELQAQLERRFRTWAENPSECDLERTLDFYALQALAFTSALESGDVFATLPWVRYPGHQFDVKVNLIEADRVCNERDRPDSDQLVGGVELGLHGEPRAIHIMRRHPGSTFLTGGERNVWDIVPVFGSRTGRRNVLHLYDKTRPGLTRGVPYLAPVIELLRQLGEYKVAEAQAALVASLFTGFVKTAGGVGLGLDASGVAPGVKPQSGDAVQLRPGALVDLAPGEDITFANPGRPNAAFEAFVTAVTREIGIALGIPYEVLVKHFQSSYSAARASLNEAWRFFKIRRAWLAQMFCQPVYEAVIEECVAKGVLDLPGFFEDPAMRAAYCGTEWTGDAPGQLDPVKEVTAAEKRLSLNLTTHADECAELTGRLWEDVIARRGREARLLEEQGMTPAPAAPSVLVPSGPLDEPIDDEE